MIRVLFFIASGLLVSCASTKIGPLVDNAKAMTCDSVLFVEGGRNIWVKDSERISGIMSLLARHSSPYFGKEPLDFYIVIACGARMDTLWVSRKSISRGTRVYPYDFQIRDDLLKLVIP